MNIEKIGKFIKELREEKGLTQDELAKKIPISRQAISKWERGLAIPDAQILLKLSEFFSVSVNEILSGEKKNKYNEKEINQISLTLYKDRNNKKRIIKLLIILLITFIFIFLIYYFFTSYRSIKVYTVSGMNDNISFYNGIFVRTKEKIFFKIGDFNILEDNGKIQSLTLYYLDTNNKKQLIVSNDDDNISFIDYIGYNNYLDTSNIDYIIKNMYIEIVFKDKKENIKLTFIEDYINDSLFFKKNQNIGYNKSDIKNTENIDINDSDLLKNIKNCYILYNTNYIYTKNDNEISTKIIYYSKTNTIKITIFSSNNILENWIYEISDDVLDYYDYTENVSYLFENGKSTCKNCNKDKLKKIIDKFYNILSESFQDNK